MSMTQILCSLLAVAIGGAWWARSARARERALGYVAAACRDADVQWLDGAVVLRRIALGRDRHGERCLHRTYVFEYSEDGASRKQGFLRLCGDDLDWIGFGPVAVPNPAWRP
jgi:Protein of unknown function (DUF3301)